MTDPKDATNQMESLPQEILDLELPSEVLSQLTQTFNDIEQNHYEEKGWQIDHDIYKGSTDISIFNIATGAFYNINIIPDEQGFEYRDVILQIKDEKQTTHSTKLFSYYLMNDKITEVTLP